MVNTFLYTGNKNLAKPAFNNTGWNTDLNKNFDMIDSALGSTQNISLQGNTNRDITLNSTTFPLVQGTIATASYVPMRIELVGALTQDTVIHVPAGVSGLWVVSNNTSGNFALYFGPTGGGAYALIPRTYTPMVWCDGSNAIFVGANSTAQFVAGDYKYSASPNAQAGWTICNGQDLASATFPALYTAIGQRYGTGVPANGTNFNVPNLIGRVLAHANQGTGVLPGVEFGVPAGNASAWLDISMMPYHNHGGGNHLHAADQDPHAHVVNGNAITGSGGNVGIAAPAWAIGTVITDTRQPPVRTYYSGDTIGAQGSGAGHSNIQPTLGCYIFIYLLG